MSPRGQAPALELVGFARVASVSIARLAAVAEAAASAAAGVEALCRGAAEEDAVSRAAEEAEDLADALAADPGRLDGGGIDRADLLMLGRALGTAGERAGAAGTAILGVRGPLGGWIHPAAVLRDAARELVPAVWGLNGRADGIDARLLRIDELSEEGRLLRRALRRDLVAETRDPVSLVVATQAVSRLDRGTAAFKLAAGVVRRIQFKHRW